MKINSSPALSYIAGTQYNNQKAAAYKKAQGSGSDELVLSKDALSFSKVYSSVREAAKTRSPEELDRIADIKARVQNGSYRVDSDKIAESLLLSLYG